MSYILDALKKAQAERQLGDLPSIHAPVFQSPAEAGQGSRWKKPLLLALLGMGGIIAVLLALLLRKAPPAAPVVRTVEPATPGLQPASVAAPAASVAPVLPPSSLASIATAASPPAMPSSPVTSPVPPTVAARAAPSHPAPAHQDKAATPAAADAVTPAPAVATGSDAAPHAAPAQDAVTQTLRDLPEPIQRSIPAISMGGYIYSKNPADRLLLIDKVLRHEGEELAPGLVLEKLLPKEAIFNYKGYRYRVPY